MIVLPPTLLLGAAFPAAARLAVHSGRVGGDVGMVLALNTAFGIGGSVVTGRRLYIQRVSNSGDAIPSLRYMR